MEVTSGKTIYFHGGALLLFGQSYEALRRAMRDAARYGLGTVLQCNRSTSLADPVGYTHILSLHELGGR